AGEGGARRRREGEGQRRGNDQGSKVMSRPRVDPQIKAARRTWAVMIRRCYDPRHDAFRYYGAEGITVCESWRRSFEQFLQDVGPRPDGMTLDRVDPSRGYEPGNVRWATHSQQMQHRRLPANSIPTCICGTCAKCKNREAVRRYIARKKVA